MRFLWNLYGISMVFLSDVFAIATGFLLDSCGISMICLWCFYWISTEFPWGSLVFWWDCYGIPLGLPWCFFWYFSGLLLGFPWDYPGVPIRILLDYHEVSMEPLWHFYGVPLGFVCFLLDVHEVSLGFLCHF